MSVLDENNSFLMGHVNELYKRLEAHQLFSRGVFEKLECLDSLNWYKEKTESVMLDMNEFQKALQLYQKRYDESIANLSKLLSDIYVHLESLDKAVEVLERNQQFLGNEVETRLVAHATNLNKAIQGIKGEIEASLEAFKDQIGASPKSIVESNERLRQEMEMAKMDAQNAMGKLSNHDYAFMIHQRRMDQAENRLKKIELLLDAQGR